MTETINGGNIESVAVRQVGKIESDAFEASFDFSPNTLLEMFDLHLSNADPVSRASDEGESGSNVGVPSAETLARKHSASGCY